MTENVIVKQLQGIAAKLTDDSELQKDLMQEIFLHLVRIHTTEPGKAPGWYLKSCEFHARNYLRPDHAVDSSDRPGDEMPGTEDRRVNGSLTSSRPVGPVEIQGEWITDDLMNLMLPRLSDRQQQVLFLLMKGCGIREAARELGVTHPAVIKHRKKIARLAHELLQDPASARVTTHNGANGNGEAQAN